MTIILSTVDILSENGILQDEIMTTLPTSPSLSILVLSQTPSAVPNIPGRFTTHYASSCEEAMRLMEKHRFDLVVTDHTNFFSQADMYGVKYMVIFTSSEDLPYSGKYGRQINEPFTYHGSQCGLSFWVFSPDFFLELGVLDPSSNIATATLKVAA